MGQIIIELDGDISDIFNTVTDTCICKSNYIYL